MAAKGSFPTPRGARVATLELVETFHKTPALVAYPVRCSKPTCHCASGDGHGPYWFLRWREGATQRRRYVKTTELDAVRAAVERRRAEDRAARSAHARALRNQKEIDRWLKAMASRDPW